MAPELVKDLILQKIPGALVTLKDLTGTQDHYEARVVSDAFLGKSPVDQHRLVYAALGPAMAGPIHALALKTYTREEWQQVGEP